MIINRITKLIGIGAFLCCSLTIAAQKLRSVSAHSNMHHDLIASQRDMSDQIKVQETREFMNELLEDEQEPEIDIYTEGWNSNLVNPYAHQAVPNNVRIDVSDYAMPVPGFILALRLPSTIQTPAQRRRPQTQHRRHRARGICRKSAFDKI